MRHLLALAIAVAALFTCTSPARAADQSAGSPIFNGKDLSGWVVEGQGKFKPTKEAKEELPVWTVADGMIHCAGKGYGFLRYDKLVCDFVLHVEYRQAKGCNSGVGIRHAKYDGRGESRPSASGYEIQILDDRNKKPDAHSGFSLYHHLPPKSNPSKPAGEWNTFVVKCVGPKIELTVNGELIHDVDQSQHKNLKDKPLCGYVSLQNHGGQIEFRNVTLAELNPEKTADLVCAEETKLRLRLQSRKTGGDGKDEVSVVLKSIRPEKTAIIICDMWDKHWCVKASERCDAIAKKMSPLIDELRAQGVHIIHCPSDTMDFYKDSPARKRILAIKTHTPPSPIDRWCKLDESKEGKLPIDDSDGGCDDENPSKSYKAWSRQHPAIKVDENRDVVSDSGVEVYNYLAENKIEHVLYCGVHTNMCVLGRSFGIRQFNKLGIDVALIRDLTDAMYNPQKEPKVDHARGTGLVIEHIEKHWCPTLVSDDLKKKKK